MTDFFFFGIFPYVALAILVVGLVWRYVTNRFTFSSLSSQFLEGRQLFWGSVPWHYGIIIILIGHLIGVIFPSGVRAFNGVPARLYVLEGIALALGLLLLVGLVVLLIRRVSSPHIRRVTTPMDMTLLFLLLLQVVSGVVISLYYRWGSAWFVETATPYLWSLGTFAPRVEFMASLPLLVKIHAVNAFVLLAVFPFTRLVHMVSVPLSYLWRPYQVVMWYRQQSQS